MPNTDSLGVEKARIQVDKRGFIQVNDQLQLHSLTFGQWENVTVKEAFTHTHTMIFKLSQAIFWRYQSKSVKDRIPIFALFCRSPLARVGMTEEEALHLNLPILKRLFL